MPQKKKIPKIRVVRGPITHIKAGEALLLPPCPEHKCAMNMTLTQDRSERSDCHWRLSCDRCQQVRQRLESEGTLEFVK